MNNNNLPNISSPSVIFSTLSPFPSRSPVSLLLNKSVLPFSSSYYASPSRSLFPLYYSSKQSSSFAPSLISSSSFSPLAPKARGYVTKTALKNKIYLIPYVSPLIVPFIYSSYASLNNNLPHTNSRYISKGFRVSFDPLSSYLINPTYIELVRYLADLIMLIPNNNSIRILINLSFAKLGARAIYKAILVRNDANPLELIHFINEKVRISIDEYGTESYQANFLYFNVFIGPKEITFPIKKIAPMTSKIKELLNNSKEAVASDLLVITDTLIASPIDLNLKTLTNIRDMTLKEPTYLIPFIENIYSIIAGEIQISSDGAEGYSKDGIYYIQIQKYGKNNKIIVRIGDKVAVTYKDTFDGIRTSREVIKTEISTKYSYINNILVSSSTTNTKVEYITAIEKKDISISKKFLTFDIETYKDDQGRHIPFACGFKAPGGVIATMWYQTEYPNQNIIKLMLDKI